MLLNADLEGCTRAQARQLAVHLIEGLEAALCCPFLCDILSNIKLLSVN